MERNIAIVICYSEHLQNRDLITSLCLGIEEEGLPYEIQAMPSEDVYTLATRASFESDLDVGIGVNTAGDLGIHQTKLPDGMVLFGENMAHINGRSYGSNAARLIKGIPFKDYEERMENQ
ncbi:glycerol dehydratase reactivase beta/small subunit family protein [Fusibacter ferrireducens]|uniref:Glycerol dehydratase reactivase beta/small subunit family protein n=1 Tax=Fusibacter ferrireducens TaxID=2785058 RepID=A0ABS0A254_9FIRM|nr:glycerol dehydratase reactivase beta/small subunit family protein [Fusibacter ferrireducens]MBF4695929.1 glycerol dehydratase reactivase beta/small subunit family protein [Fusibacter ferrireducens]